MTGTRTQVSLAALVALVLLAVGCTAARPSDRIGQNTTPTAPTTVVSSSSITATTVVTTSTTMVPPLDATFDAIATRTTMTDEARSLLALSNPTLVDPSALAATCTLDPELSLLGCYRSGQIAVLAVTDPRLQGMTEATTAHEVLHAGWTTLDGSERERLTQLLQTAFDRVATTQLTARIEAYRERDPAVVGNELHSILGTEVADVGPELEAYYRRWFVDRSAVVELAVGARATFVALDAQVDDLDTRLGELLSLIESEEAILENDRATLEVRSAELDALRAAGQIDDYNAGVGPFNDLVRLLNDSVSAVQNLVEEYNALVSERNDLAASYTDLVAQITTSAESLPSS